MRIAICLNGQPRTWAKNVKNWISIFSSWGEVDFFFHFWDYNSDSTLSQHQSGPTLDRKITAQEQQIIVDTLQPKKWIFESYLDAELKPNLREVIAPWAHSQFYSLWRSALLKRSYEIENNFEYDLVVRLRSDLIINTPFDPPKKKPSTVYAVHNLTREQCEFGVPRMSDIFFISDSVTFDHMALFYDSLNFIDSYHVIPGKDEKPFPPEVALTYYCSMLGIKIVPRHDLVLRIRRDTEHLKRVGSLAEYEII